MHADRYDFADLRKPVGMEMRICAWHACKMDLCLARCFRGCAFPGGDGVAAAVVAADLAAVVTAQWLWSSLVLVAVTVALVLGRVAQTSRRAYH